MSVNPEDDIVLSLLSNKDFKDWILNPSGDRDLYWQNWMRSNPDKVQAVNKATKIIQQLKFREDFLSEKEVDHLLGNIISEKDSARAGKLVSLKRQGSLRLLKIAASLLLLLSVGFYAYRNLSNVRNTEAALDKIETLKGQRTRIELPDGSIVHLNASSSLTFPESFTESARTVELTGEAFFEVVKDPSRPFVVKTNDFLTEVLGTSFNVRAFKTDVAADVSLVTGKVRVTREDTSPEDAPEHLLVPGERLIYDKASRSFKKEPFNTADITGWKDGVLVFNDTDFPGVIEKLEQWYGVEITVVSKPSEAWHVAGHFNNESLEEVLTSIQFVYDIEYTINGNNLTLKCN
jgi:ferric-dicitrate binding protein FerR (iron transport regulator)